MRIILAAVVLAVAAPAQGSTWANVTPSSPSLSPTGRYLHGMTYDIARKRAVVFGGLTSYSSNTNSNETWEWDGSAWQLRTTAIAPSARRQFGFAYDTGRSVSVLFGGYQTTALPQSADTWEWNGTAWSQRTPAASPSLRASHAMAYDAARQKVILFGGLGAAGALADTWEWNGTTWTQRTPSASPSARLGHAMTYDAVRQRIVLFGGLTAATSGTSLADTWEWDGTNWLAGFSATFPPARYDAALAFDAARNRCVLYGGLNANNGDFDDTWEWNGVSWSQRSNGGIGVRRQSRAAFDVANQRVMLFGGLQPCCYSSNETFGVANAAAIEFGVGCGPSPLQLLKDAANRPLIGSNGLATVANAPTPVAAMAMGFSRTTYGPFTLPVPLDSVGMNGCMLWQSSDIVGIGLTQITPTSLVFLLAIPNSSSLIGGRLFLQGYGFAPGANPLQVIASNGLEWRLGAF